MQIHKSCEISVLKRLFCSSVDLKATKTYCINEHGGGDDDDDDDHHHHHHLDNEIHVDFSRHRIREC
jgi:hypothetical protein